MTKTIPVLPCCNADHLVNFYKSLGFELIGKYVRSYIILRYEDIELHFYGTKQIKPEENSCMCIIQTTDLEQIHNAFENGLKLFSGELRRSGFPKISKIRNLSEDMRFTLSDTSGNTLYILTPKESGSDNFFRDLESIKHTHNFSILYDLIYSKEDLKVAGNMLPKLLEIKNELNDLDKAKLLILALEIQNNFASYEQELRVLITNNTSNKNWELIEQKLDEIIN